MLKISAPYKIFFTIILSFFICSIMHAQQGNIWYFGENAGLNFNTNPPTALTNGQLNTREGCSSICDKNGNLLFYTDGVTVYNRNHQIMPNGNGLSGDPSSSNSSVVIPKPGSTNIYYIFTADAVENSYVKGYRYSELNMTLAGGLGDIVVNQKNILLYAPCTEKLTAVKHANGIDYWVITRGFGNNNFAIYKVGCNGVNTMPIITSIGQVATQLVDGTGCIKASPDGKKLSMVQRSAISKAQLYDFDNSTGIVSNLIELDGYDPYSIYGVEFSPNGRLLYVTPTDFKIYQYDISSNNQITINASKYTLFGLAGEDNQAMQLGPDKKLYIAIQQIPFLNVINNPDVYGIGCNLNTHGVDLAGRNCMYGLPNYITSFFDANNRVDFTHFFEDCHIKFTGSTDLNNVLQWYWDFGDGTTGTGQIINHSYRQVGTYNVTLKGVPIGSCASTDTFFVSHPVTINTVLFSIDFTKQGNCFGTPYTFTNNTVLNVGTITGYSWDFGDNTPLVITPNATHTYAAPGEYDVKLVVSTSGICRADSFIKKIYVDTKPTIAFNPAKSCINMPIQFTNNSTNTVGGIGIWQWSFGNGDVSNNQFPNYAYNTVGPYTASLTATSTHGCVSNTVGNPITIFDKPTANYKVTIPCVQQGTIFTDLSPTNNGNITDWNWVFGDGNTSSDRNPTHIYTNTLPYATSLVVKSEYGCFSTPKAVPIQIKRVTAFAGNDTTSTFDAPLQLTGSGGTSYSWQPPTGLNNATIYNPIARLRDDMTYTLTATDDDGCFDDDKIFIKVYVNNDVLVPSAFTPDGNGKNDVIKPLGFGLKAIEYFEIFNRYGELVFTTKTIDVGWNGLYKGKPQPAGTYTFRVKAINYKNRAVEKIGTFILIR